MHKQRTLCRIVFAAALLASVAGFPRWLAVAGTNAPPEKPAPEEPTREIFVPYEDLHVLLERQPRRVLLSRSEYEALLEAAEKSPELQAPWATNLVSADYSVTLTAGRARIDGTLVLDVLKDGLHAVPLDLSGVGLQHAMLDGVGASIGGASIGGETPSTMKLFVQGKGRHTLTLGMVLPLQTKAAQQEVRFRLPRPPTAKMRLSVPGDVEMKSGATVVTREVDADAGVTRFELLPPRGDAILVMTLNSRMKGVHRSVTARSVLVAEVTETYEKLHATVALTVFRAIDQIRFSVPDQFEITEVRSPLLARWNVEQLDGSRVLNVELREPAEGNVVLNVLAIRTPSRLEAWQWPQLKPLDIEGQMTIVSQVAVVGLLVDERLDAESITAANLIPINTDALRQALPETIAEAASGVPPLVAYYAPASDFSLDAKFTIPPAEMAVRTSLLWVLSDKGQQILGGLTMLPAVEKRFSFDFSIPPDWHVTGVTGPDEQPLPMERYDRPDGPTIHVRVPQGIPVGEEFHANFEALHTPDKWLAEWDEQMIDFPAFAITSTGSDVGAIGVAVLDDLAIRPEQVDLTPLDDAKKSEHGLVAGVDTALAYRYERPGYKATFHLKRTQPRLTARTCSFFVVRPDELRGYCEVAYRVEEARTRQLTFELPADTTPEALSIRGLDGVTLKQYDSQLDGEVRRWKVQLEEPRRGTIRLAVEFRQPVLAENLKKLPIIRAADVQYQSGLVAVEGSAELDVKVTTDARPVDVGELAEADYRLGRRLLGTFGFVGDPFVGDQAVVKVDVFRRPGRGLPSVIAQQVELTSQLSPHGTSQTDARFVLRTKALYLAVELPEGSVLWSAFLDGKPTKPQRKDGHLLVSLPATSGTTKRTLQIVYETPVRAIAGRLLSAGRLTLPAPKLFPRDAQGKNGAEVPLVNLVWKVELPRGYEMAESGGTLVPRKPSKLDPTAMRFSKPEPAAITLAKGLAVATGGVNSQWMNVVQASREAARRSRQAGYDRSDAESEGVGYYDDSGADYGGEGEGDEGGEEGGEAWGEDATDASEEAPDDDMRPTEGRQAEDSEPMDSAEGEAEAPEETPPMEPSTPELVADTPLVPGFEGAAGDGPQDVTVARTPPAKRSRFDLEGHRSLKTELTPDKKRTIVFYSLGVEPELSITLTQRSRHDALTWTLVLVIGLIGLARTNRTVAAKTRFVLLLALITTIVALWVENSTWIDTCNHLFWTAMALVPYYLLIGLLRRPLRCLAEQTCCCRRWLGFSSATAGLLLLMCWATQSAAAELPEAKLGPYVIQIAKPPTPVDVPDDAILLPYDPTSPSAIREADQLMVPYTRYVELWNRAHPEEKIDAPKVSPGWALSVASYSVVLDSDETLLLSGSLQFEVFTDGYVTIPLSLSGGVLARAELDGKPARLSLAAVDRQLPPGANDNAPNGPPNANPGVQPPPDGSVLLLHASGKGRHRLDVSVRLRLSRQGGWRVAGGVVPATAATSLSLLVPRSQTELKLGAVADRSSYETEQANEKIETAIGADGRIDIRWRPIVAEGQVDESLKAQSDALLDVREEGLRLVWRLGLTFPSGQRERFTVTVPPEYLVEDIRGANVQGWELTDAARQTVEVTLLKAAEGNEELIFHLFRSGTVGEGELAQFDVPVVDVAAAMHSGRLTIRRSPLLDLQTVEAGDVTRTDIRPEAAKLADLRGGEEPPLHIRPFEAYNFVAVPFSIRLTAAPVRADVTATVQTLLKVDPLRQDFESRVTFHVKRRPLHAVEMLIPENLDLENVLAPGRFHWAVTRRDTRRLLSVYLSAGREGDVPITIQGILTRPEPEEQPDGPKDAIPELALPQLDVLGVTRQRGDIGVQVDPAINVEAVHLTNCQKVLPRRLLEWLNPEQYNVTRLALQYDRRLGDGDYSGTLQFKRRQPVVRCSTITNVRVTDRTIEEMILLDFTIRDAGIRRLAFRLPARMKDCRIDHPLLSHKTFTTVGDSVRVQLEFQDEVMDELSIRVLNDRLLQPSELYDAPIPTVEIGRTDRRFVVLQGAGRDEVVVDAKKLVDVSLMGRQQKQWRTLAEILPGEIMQAYLVRTGAEKPGLEFRTERRKAVETVGASIGLAQTRLWLDANGAYRAETVYQTNNSIEQFLVVELPPGAELWTALVAGQPVKPTRVPGSTNDRRLRIPIVKTVSGDLDYSVVLKYGGKMPELGRTANVQFPFVKTVNISVARTGVWLFVPKTHRWLRFDGTMSRQGEEADMAAQFVSYQTAETKRVIEAGQSGDHFVKMRALSNVKQLGAEFLQYQQTQQDYVPNAALEAEMRGNAQVLQEAEQLESKPQLDVLDNSGYLNQRYEDQKVTRSGNVVQGLGYNWSGTLPTSGEKTEGKQVFNERWLDKNKLNNPKLAVSQGKGEGSADGGKPGGRQYGPDAPMQPVAAQPKAPDVMTGRAKANLSAIQQQAQPVAQIQSGDRGQAVVRYEKQLQDQQGFGVDPLQVDLGEIGLERAPRRDMADSITDYRTAQPDEFGRVVRGEDDELDRPFQVSGRVIETRTGTRQSTATLGPTMSEGLASVDVQMPDEDPNYDPNYYETFRFTTTSAKVEIVGRAASGDTLSDLGYLAVVLTMLGLGGLCVRFFRNGRFAWMKTRAGSTGLICVGLILLCLLVLVGVGLAMVIGGLAVKIHLASEARKAATPKPQPA